MISDENRHPPVPSPPIRNAGQPGKGARKASHAQPLPVLWNCKPNAATERQLSGPNPCHNPAEFRHRLQPKAASPFMWDLSSATLCRFIPALSARPDLGIPDCICTRSYWLNTVGCAPIYEDISIEELQKVTPDQGWLQFRLNQARPHLKTFPNRHIPLLRVCP